MTLFNTVCNTINLVASYSERSTEVHVFRSQIYNSNDLTVDGLVRDVKIFKS